MSQRYLSYPPLDPSAIHPASHIKVIEPRPLAPLQEPPSPASFPQLPSSIRNPSFNSSYTLTTHLYPSAYPHHPSSPLPRTSYADIPGETKTARIARQKSLLQELWLLNRKGAKNNGHKPQEYGVLWNVVNRFARRDLDEGHEKRGLTLFLAHANGFPKETWEPFIQEMLSRAEEAGILIHEVWAFDAVQHGDSALVNDHILGNVFDWADNSRDILNFLLYHLPEHNSLVQLPTHLPRLSEAVSTQRSTSGYTYRTLVAIGHSLGGCSVARAALAYPALFSSLILIDPVIAPFWAQPLEETTIATLATLAIHRRTNWPSREEALATFQSSPYFRAWRPDVFHSYVQYGICPDYSISKDSVQLKMTGTQEAIVFMGRHFAYETWELLPQLDKRIELFFVLSGKDTSAVGGDQAAHELVWRRPGNVSNIVIPFAGHLIPQEVPQELAILVVEFLKGKYSYANMRSPQRSLL